MGKMAQFLFHISWRIHQLKNFENLATFVIVMKECIVAQFFLLTVYISITAYHF